MPVLGHAFVGWSTALAVAPRVAPGAADARAATLWVPALVALAYGPDVLAQGGLALGSAEVTQVTHSLAFALLLAPLAGSALGLVLGVRRAQGVAVTLGSLVLHDLLDLLQTPERQILWPFSGWHLGEGSAVLPVSGSREALVFSCGFAVYVVARHLTRPADPERHRLHRFASVALAGVVIAAAGTTHYLRLVRERQLERARSLVADGRFVAALAEGTAAARWPSTAHPGRVDQVRAEALEELGELEAAIASYSRAVEADPTYFWALADLTAACARSQRQERLAGARLLRARLLHDFPHHPALGQALARIDERLSGGAP